MPKSSSNRKTSGKSARRTPQTTPTTTSWESIHASISARPVASPLYVNSVGVNSVGVNSGGGDSGGANSGGGDSGSTGLSGATRVTSPLAWGLDFPPATFGHSDGEAIGRGEGSEPFELLQRCERVARGKTGKDIRSQGWSEAVQSFLDSLGQTVERETCYWALAWTHAAPSLANLLDCQAWTALLNGLVGLVVDAIEQGTGDNAVIQQLMIELSITLEVLFPSSGALSAHADDVRKRASFAITDLTDGEGIPRSSAVRALRPLLASWVRMGLLAQESGQRVFDEDAQMQLEWLIRQSMVLSRAGGTPLFCAGAKTDSPGSSDQTATDFIEAALAWEKDEEDALYAASLLGIGPLRVSGKKAKKSLANEADLEFDSPTLYSEWASLAVMRAAWDTKSPVVAVAFEDRKFLTDVSIKRKPMICGDSTPFVRIDGKLAEFVSDITEVCWHSDNECDYLELEVKLSGGWRLQRQYLYGREDCFLWIADVLLGNESAKIEYSCPWPIGSAYQVVPSEETRDLTFTVDDRVRASVIAPASAEWRVLRSHCELEANDVGVHHRFETDAKAAYIPIFIDLDKKRSSQERTWRQLTVAEQLEITTPDVAAGFRVQSGDDQWLFYRSLGLRGNRSLLGQNTVAEFLAGRFQRDGLLDELVEVE